MGCAVWRPQYLWFPLGVVIKRGCQQRCTRMFSSSHCSTTTVAENSAQGLQPLRGHFRNGNEHTGAAHSNADEPLKHHVRPRKGARPQGHRDDPLHKVPTVKKQSSAERSPQGGWAEMPPFVIRAVVTRVPSLGQKSVSVAHRIWCSCRCGYLHYRSRFYRKLGC